jgi:hypothetical protein
MMIKRKMKNNALTIVVGTTILLTSIALTLGISNAYAQTHYQIGYDDGCAGRVVEGHHTSEYKRGYADGQSACSGGGRNPVTQPPINPRPIPNTSTTTTAEHSS